MKFDYRSMYTISKNKKNAIVRPHAWATVHLVYVLLTAISTVYLKIMDIYWSYFKQT